LTLKSVGVALWVRGVVSVPGACLLQASTP